MYELSEESIKELSALVDEINNFNGKWFGSRKDKDNYLYPFTDELAWNAMSFLYDKDLIIGFDWMKWKEGREFFKSKDPNKYENLEREFILKLLTAIARQDRFCDGAWGGIFEDGIAQILYSKLLETYKK